jgi:hypothetical protein
MPELAAYLKATGEADPLVGNYVLLRQDDVVLAYQGAGEQFLLQAFEVSAGKTPKLEQSGKLDVGAPQPSQHDALAAGDFDGNHLDEIASAYSEAGTLKLVTARNQDPATTAHSLSVGSKPVEVGAFGGGRIGLAAGHFVLASDTSGVQPSTLALAWSDAGGHLHIEIWGTDTKLAPKRIAAATGPKVSAGNLALAAADLDGDGKSGMVVAWQGSADSKGRDLFMCLYRLDTTGKALTASTVIPVADLGGNASFDIAGGQFSSLSTSEEVALAWSDKKKHANAQLFKLDSKGAFVTAGKGYVDSANPVTDSMLVRLAAGDLDLDGIDELVLGSVGTKDSNPAILFLHILKPDNELNLNLPGPHSLGAIIGEPNTAFASIDCQLAIGELGPGRLLGIVVGALGTKGLSGLAGKAELAVGVVEVDPALDLPPVRSVGGPHRRPDHPRCGGRPQAEHHPRLGAGRLQRQEHPRGTAQAPQLPAGQRRHRHHQHAARRGQHQLQHGSRPDLHQFEGRADKLRCLGHQGLDLVQGLGGQSGSGFDRPSQRQHDPHLRQGLFQDSRQYQDRHQLSQRDPCSGRRHHSLGNQL